MIKKDKLENKLIELADDLRNDKGVETIFPVKVMGTVGNRYYLILNDQVIFYATKYDSDIRMGLKIDVPDLGDDSAVYTKIRKFASDLREEISKND